MSGLIVVDSDCGSSNSPIRGREEHDRADKNSLFFRERLAALEALEELFQDAHLNRV